MWRYYMKNKKKRFQEQVYLVLKAEHKTIDGSKSLLSYEVLENIADKRDTMIRLLDAILVEPNDILLTLRSFINENPIKYREEVIKDEKVVEITSWIDIFRYIFQSIRPEDYYMRISNHDRVFEESTVIARYGKLIEKCDEQKKFKEVRVIENVMDKLEKLGIERFIVNIEPNGIKFVNAEPDLISKNQKIPSFHQYIPSHINKYIWRFISHRLHEYESLQSIFGSIKSENDSAVVFRWERDNRLRHPAMLVTPVRNSYQDPFLLID